MIAIAKVFNSGRSQAVRVPIMQGFFCKIIDMKRSNPFF